MRAFFHFCVLARRPREWSISAIDFVRRMKLAGRTLAATVGVLCFVAAAAGSVGPLVRARVRTAGANHHLLVDVASVSPGFSGVTLSGVHVRLADGAGLDVFLPAVRVELGGFLAPRRVSVEGGQVRFAGSVEELAAAIRQVKSTGMATSGGGTDAVALSISGLAVQWSDRTGAEPFVDIHAAALARQGDRWRAAIDRVGVQAAGMHVELTSAALEADAHGVILTAHASSLAVSLEGVRRSALAALPADPLLAPSHEPSPRASVEVGGSHSIPLPVPDLDAMRGRVVALGALVRERLAPDANLDIGAIAVSVGSGERAVSIGQGPLTIRRNGTSLDATFATRPAATGTPLTLTGALPLDAGDVVLSLSGGPISLSRLGIAEGAGGLVDVDRAMLTGRGRASFSAAGDALAFDCELAVRGLALSEPRIARQTVRDVDGTVLVRGVLDTRGSLRVDDLELALGALRLLGRGTAEQVDGDLVASLAVELPSAPCETLLRSIPSALVPTLDGAEMTGSFGATGRIAFNSRDLDELVLNWDVADRCTMTTVPEALAKERFAQPFEHTIYEPDGTLEQETTGPTSDNWTELERVSPFMQVAVLTTEDGAFYRHHGFNRAAMRNALVADLKAGHFIRGASTITMQLAKNLFLSRDKTLSRKLEEVILADYLEASFTKREMMELYLNVIEFGPSLYGITHAAAAYFGRTPAELNLAESLLLASMLPSPLRYAKLAEKPQLSESWMKRLHELMSLAARNGLISPTELAEGLKETVTFHDPQAPPPDPRTPVAGTHFQSTNGQVNAEWTETP